MELIAHSVEELCLGFPDEICVFIRYCRNLKFDERPDYAYLKKILKDMFEKEAFENDSIYDWTILNYIKPLNLESFYKERRSVVVIEESKVETLIVPSLIPLQDQKSKKCGIF